MEQKKMQHRVTGSGLYKLLSLTSITIFLVGCISDTSNPIQENASSEFVQQISGVWDSSAEKAVEPDGALGTDEQYRVIESTPEGSLFISFYDYMGDSFNGPSNDFLNCYTLVQSQTVNLHENDFFSFGSQWVRLSDDSTLLHAISADDALRGNFTNEWTKTTFTTTDFTPLCEESITDSSVENELSTVDSTNTNVDQPSGSSPQTSAETEQNANISASENQPGFAGDNSATVDGAGTPEPTDDQNNLVRVPLTGAYIGMNTGDTANGISVASREQLLGHKVAIERIFYGNRHWSLDRINIDQIVNAHNNGRIPMVSYKVGAWKDVINGNSDAIIDKLAQQIKESDIPVLLTFHHEAEDDACTNSNPGCGEGQTAEDYVAMWRYMHDRFALLEVTNVSWNWVVMGWQWSPAGNTQVREHIESMFPGSSYVDWISADLYNIAGNCNLTEAQISNRWSQLEVQGQGWYDWASRFNKPLALAEWGTFDDVLENGRKAQWYRNASATLQTWTNIKAVVYFDRLHDGCDWRIDSGGAVELDGYRDLINDPYFIKG